MITKRLFLFIGLALSVVTGAKAQSANDHDVTDQFLTNAKFNNGGTGNTSTTGWTITSDNKSVDVINTTSGVVKIYPQKHSTGFFQSNYSNSHVAQTAKKAFAVDKVYKVSFQIAQSTTTEENKGYLVLADNSGADINNTLTILDEKTLNPVNTVGKFGNSNKEYQIKGTERADEDLDAAGFKNLFAENGGTRGLVSVYFEVKTAFTPKFDFYQPAQSNNLGFANVTIEEYGKNELDFMLLQKQALHVLESKDWNAVTDDINYGQGNTNLRTNLEKAANPTLSNNPTEQEYATALSALKTAYVNYRAYRSNIVGELTADGKTTTSGKVVYIGKLDANDKNRWYTTTPENVDFNFPNETATKAGWPNEHWSGDGRKYINQNDFDEEGHNTQGYFSPNGFKFDISYNVIPLGPGTYIAKFAARRSDNMTARLKTYIIKNENGVDVDKREIMKTISEYQEFPITERQTLDNEELQTFGYGIAKDGTAAYTHEKGDQFVNHNLGRGWAWCYMIYTITEEDVKNHSITETVWVDSEQQWKEMSGVRVRYELEAEAGVGGQYISISDCSLYKVIEDENNNLPYERRTWEHNNTDSRWGTICTPYTCSIPENVLCYEVLGTIVDKQTGKGKVILCEQADVLEAGMGYVFHANTNDTKLYFPESGYFTGANLAFNDKNGLRGYLPNSKVAGNLAQNMPEFMSEENNPYVMNAGKWRKINRNHADFSTYTLVPYRAFLLNLPGEVDENGNSLEDSDIQQGDTSAPANRRLLAMGIIGDDTSGIFDIENEAEESNVAYNLNGQRVNKNAKGIVIINGKKYLNK